MNKNQDFVAIDHRIEAGWDFRIPFTAETTTAANDEFLGICQQVFDTFEDFLRPTAVTVGLDLLSEELPLSTYLDEVLNHQHSAVAFEVVDSSGVSFESILQELDDAGQDEEHPIPRSVRFDEAATKVTLDDWEGFVSKTSDRVEAWSSGKETIHEDGEVYNDPVSAGIFVNHFAVESPEVNLKVEPHTDIWAEDTEIGRINRDRLEGVLEELQDELDGATVEFDCKYPYIWS